MLTDDGALNALGQLYTGAKTVHTENVTSGPTATYNTVNGADNPTFAPASTFPAVFSSAVISRESPLSLVVLFVTVVLAPIVIGISGILYAA